jgi:hypothetical protein
MKEPKASAEDVQRDLLARIQTEGVLAAYEASLAICRDNKAPSPAKATASSTLFRVAGYFDRAADRDRTKKDPHEMTPDELAAEIRRIRRSQEAASGDDVPGDVFA